MTTQEDGHFEIYTVNPFQLAPVIREVCKHLSTPDLLRVCYINNTWRLVSRVVLRDFKPCLFRTLPGKSCERLRDFENFLLQQELPFVNGIAIRMSSDHNRRNFCCQVHPSGANVGDIMFALLRIKHLTVHWLGPSTSWSCPVVQLLRRCIEERPQDIISMHFEHFPTRARIFPNNHLQLCFPNLHKIRSGLRRLPGNLMPKLVEAAPCLEEFDSEISHTDLKRGLIPENKLGAVVNLNFVSIGSTANLSQYEKLALADPKLRKLQAHAPSFKRTSLLLSAWDCLQRLLLSSADTLTTLRLDALVVLMMEDLHTRPFRNVTDLKMKVPVRDCAQPLHQALANVNFSRLFPALTAVVVEVQQSYKREFDHSLYERFRNRTTRTPAPPDEDRGTIRTVTLGHCWHGPLAPCVMNAFRGATSVRAEAMQECRYLWDWPGLTQITLRYYGNGNLDAEFCGLNPEEVSLLQQQSESFLNSLHIVPVRKPINYHKSLRKLFVNHNGGHPTPTGSSSTIFLSRVTCALALRRMKQPLDFTIKCPRYYVGALEHLRSQAKIVTF